MATLKGAEERITQIGFALDEYKSDLLLAPEDADPNRALELAKELEALPALLEEYQDLRYQAQKAMRQGCRRGGAIDLSLVTPCRPDTE